MCAGPGSCSVEGLECSRSSSSARDGGPGTAARRWHRRTIRPCSLSPPCASPARREGLRAHIEVHWWPRRRARNRIRDRRRRRRGPPRAVEDPAQQRVHLPCMLARARLRRPPRSLGGPSEGSTARWTARARPARAAHALVRCPNHGSRRAFFEPRARHELYQPAAAPTHTARSPSATLQLSVSPPAVAFVPASDDETRTIARDTAPPRDGRWKQGSHPNARCAPFPPTTPPPVRRPRSRAAAPAAVSRPMHVSTLFATWTSTSTPARTAACRSCTGAVQSLDDHLDATDPPLHLPRAAVPARPFGAPGAYTRLPMAPHGGM